jgi:hypothetical protein
VSLCVPSGALLLGGRTSTFEEDALDNLLDHQREQLSLIVGLASIQATSAGLRTSPVLLMKSSPQAA